MSESQEQLRDAVRAVIDAKREEVLTDRANRQKARRRAARRGPTIALMVVLWGALAWIWAARPAWIFAPIVEKPAMSAAQREATGRYALFLQRARIADYRREHGRLPTVLTDLKPVEPGVRYERTGSGYILELDVDGNTLRLTDAMSSDSFLGESLRILQSR